MDCLELRRGSTGTARLSAIMTKTSDNASAMTADHIGDDDTIELALTAEDVLALSRAAEEAYAEARQSKSTPTTVDAFHPGQSARFGTWPVTLALSVLGIVIAIALGLAADHVHTIRVVASAVETAPTESQESPVQFNNPFDASEVFEFPPGTSDDKARESVAALLLERARDRQRTELAKSRPATPGPAARTRMARNSESHLTSGPASEPRWR